MFDLNFLFEDRPPFQKIIELRGFQETSQFKELILSRLEKIKDAEESDEEYVAIARAYNFLKYRQDDSIFYESLDLYEALDHEEDHHEVLATSVNFYLNKTVSCKHSDKLFNRLKAYREDGDFPDTSHLFELLLQTSFRTDEFLKICLDEFFDYYTSELTRLIIAEGYDHPQIKGAVKSRMDFLSPYIKYFPETDSYNPYVSEWQELGHLLYPEKNHHTFEKDLSKDDDFIIEILGHTDERSSDLIMKRSKEYTANLSSPPRDIKEKLFQEYLIALPDDPLIWIENAPEDLREQFIHYSNRLSKRKSRQDLLSKIVNKSKPKVGRNDPCPCGSGKKYKKCHLDKTI